jgi:plastocyanin
MKLKALLAPFLLVLMFSLAACGDDGDSDTSAETQTVTEMAETTPEPSGNAPAPSGEAVRSAKVEIAGFAYDPDPVTIQTGGKVTWINRDATPHTATAEDGAFDTGTLEQGKLKSENFKEPGTYRYICEIHPTMHGTVEVVD